MIDKVFNYFNKPIHSAPLISFKFIFGALMVFSTLRFMYLGWIEDHYINPTFHFKYWGFEWISPLSQSGMYIVHIIMTLAAIGIMFSYGWLYRLSAITLFLTFTYTELIDLTYYLNHYYFVSLTCFLLCLLPANNSICFGNYSNKIPLWSILILKAQIAIVYLYAGVAKINYEWLINAMPLKIWLPANDKLNVIGEIFTWTNTPYVFSWMGMIFDCCIVFFLIYKPTRIWAYITIVLFHTMTGILFQIGVFPLVMIGATLIFFSDNWHFKFIGFIRKLLSIKLKFPLIKRSTYNLKNNIILSLLIPYFIFQLIFPWRFIFYDGNMFWTEQGYRFGWRVMLMEKAGTATFYVKDSKTEREGIVNNSDFLNPHQEKQMSMQPDMILQFAHFLGKHYEKKGIYNPKVRVEAYVTMNARPSMLLIDPDVDLMKKNDTFAPKNWILPYED